MKFRDRKKGTPIKGMVVRPEIRSLTRFVKARRRRTFAVVLAGIVACTSTYAMILPALTLDDRMMTQIPGFHVQNRGTAAETMGYQVNEETGAVAGEQIDGAEHIHDESCYDEEGTLICDLPEQENSSETESSEVIDTEVSESAEADAQAEKDEPMTADSTGAESVSVSEGSANNPSVETENESDAVDVRIEES